MNEEIQFWIDQHSDATALAAMLSLAALADPALLRAARLELGLNVSAESDVWFSPLIEQRSRSGLVLLDAVLPEMRSTLVSSGRLEIAWKLTEARHASLASAIRLEETLTYLALKNEQDALAKIDNLLRPVLVAMLKDGRKSLASWAAYAMPRLPETLRSAAPVQWLAQAAKAYGFARVAGFDVAGAPPQWMVNALRPTQQNIVTTGVRLYPSKAEFYYPAVPDSITLSIPGDLTLWATWWHTGEKHVHEVHLGNGEAVSIPFGARELSIETVVGSYLLRDKTLEAQKRHVYLSVTSSVQSDAAQYMYNELLARGHQVFWADWQPTSSDRAERTRQIQATDLMVLLARDDPGGLIVWWDLQIARQACRRIVFLKDPASSSWSNLELGEHVIELGPTSDWPRALSLLLEELSDTSGRLAPVDHLSVPAPMYYPKHVVNDVASLLLSDVPIVGLTGAAGSGKTVIAALVCRACAIRRRFPGGIHWPRDDNSWPEPGAAAPYLVVSDEPRPEHLDSTVQTAARIANDGNSRVLILLRADSANPLPAQQVVDIQWDRDAIQALFSAADLSMTEADIGLITDLADDKAAAASNAARLWGIASMKGAGENRDRLIAQLREDPALRDSAKRILGGLDEVAPALAFRPNDAGWPAAVWPVAFATAEDAAAVRETLLSAGLLQRFDQIFLLDAYVWSLLHDSDLSTAGHRRIVESYIKQCASDWIAGPDDGYFVENLAYHLVAAGQKEEWRELILDLDWLERVLRRPSGRAALLDDLKLSPHEGESEILQKLVYELPPQLESSLEPFWASSSLSSRPVRVAKARASMRGGNVRRRVLVVGTSSLQLPVPVNTLAIRLGRQLARNGYGLITGACQGVDYVVAREYCLELDRLRIPVDFGLTQVVSPQRQPDFPLGRVQSSQTDIELAVSQAHAVVVIEGHEGTRKVCERAFASRVPVLGIIASGGTAAHLSAQHHAISGSLETDRDAVRMARMICARIEEVARQTAGNPPKDRPPTRSSKKTSKKR